MSSRHNRLLLIITVDGKRQDAILYDGSMSTWWQPLGTAAEIQIFNGPATIQEQMYPLPAAGLCSIFPLVTDFVRESNGHQITLLGQSPVVGGISGQEAPNVYLMPSKVHLLRYGNGVVCPSDCTIDGRDGVMQEWIYFKYGILSNTTFASDMTLHEYGRYMASSGEAESKPFTAYSYDLLSQSTASLPSEWFDKSYWINTGDTVTDTTAIKPITFSFERGAGSFADQELKQQYYNGLADSETSVKSRPDVFPGILLFVLAGGMLIYIFVRRLGRKV
jgi:hypothetical protein